MATVEVNLEFPITIGKEEIKTIVLRELTSGDVLDAQQESERLVQMEDGPALVTSPGLVGVNTLRRQIKKLGSIDGPASISDLRKLNPIDFDALQGAALKMEQAVVKAIESASREVAQRGRLDEPPHAD